METIKKVKPKTFDAVKMMRDSRDKISAETSGMSLKELQEYINKKLEQSNTVRIGQK